MLLLSVAGLTSGFKIEKLKWIKGWRLVSTPTEIHRSPSK